VGLADELGRGVVVLFLLPVDRDLRLAHLGQGLCFSGAGHTTRLLRGNLVERSVRRPCLLGATAAPIPSFEWMHGHSCGQQARPLRGGPADPARARGGGTPPPKGTRGPLPPLRRRSSATVQGSARVRRRPGRQAASSPTRGNASWRSSGPEGDAA